MAIRHAVSLRGAAEAISQRFLALLGMTFQVRLLRFTRNDDSYLCSGVGTENLECPRSKEIDRPGD